MCIGPRGALLEAFEVGKQLVVYKIGEVAAGKGIARYKFVPDAIGFQASFTIWRMLSIKVWLNQTPFARKS